MERYKKYVTLGLLILTGVSVLRTVLLLWGSTFLDFTVLYHTTQSLFIQNDPYRISINNLTANYPPPLYLLLLPLLFMPLSMAANIFLLISLFFSTVGIIILKKLFDLSNLDFVLIQFLFVISFPFKFTLGMGQINLIALGLLCIFLSTLWNGRASIAFVLAIFTKMFPIVFVLVAIAERKKKFIFESILIFLVFVLVSFIMFGSLPHLSYVSVLLSFILDQHFATDYYNQSLTGSLARLDFPLVIIQILRAALLFVSIIYIFVRKYHPIWKLTLLLQTILIINVITWQHHLVFTLIPFALLYSRLKGVLYKVLLLSAYLLIGYNITQPSLLAENTFGNLLLAHGFLGMIILWFLLLSTRYEK